MQFEINMRMPEGEFRKQIDTLVRTSRTTESVLPLPLHIGEYGIESMALVLGQINCEGCEALCCRTYKYAEFGIPFLDSEYKALAERIGQERLAKMDVKSIGSTKYFPTPCPFLHKKRCTIYDIRPIVCVQYPFDISGVDMSGEGKFMSLDPLCPEARRIAKRTYLALWKLINKMEEVSSQMSELKQAAIYEQTLRNLKAGD